MEANICDINNLDADVLLPPRKRLLAGFKKQASNMNGASDHQSTVASSSSLSPPSPSPSPSPPPSPSPSLSTSSIDVNAHLQNLLMSSRLYNPDHSPEDILASSRAAATSAAKAAEAARAVAEEKAAIATKAIAAAKSALDLVAKFSEESDNKDRHLKKNKLKKHVPVELLYRKHESIGSPRTDEELARKLHRAINNSPRISKTSPASESRGHKHKRAKILPTLEKTKASNGGIVLGGSPSSICNGGTIAGEIDSLDSVEESDKAGAKGTKYGKYGQSELDGEAESSHSRGKAFEDVTPGKKRGRMKLKKLPLSICSFRDRVTVNPKEEMITKSSPLTEKNMDNSTVTVKPFFPMEPSDDGVISIEGMRKCQDFKAPACIKQNKVMQS